jgi:hypothetical protein
LKCFVTQSCLRADCYDELDSEKGEILMATKECVACAEEIQSNARMCRFCSVIQDDPRFVIDEYLDLDEDFEPVPKSANAGQESRSPSGSKKSPLACPVCKKDDASQTVGSIVDGGVSSTSGSALTMGRNFQYSATGFSSTSVSNLAWRLAGPEQPGYGFLAGFGFAYLCSIVAIAGWFLQSSMYKESVAAVGPQGTGTALLLYLFISGAIALVPGLIFAFPAARGFNSQGKMAARIQVWEANQSLLRKARYCFRDDVVYDSEYGGTPESYIAKIWQ